MPIGNGPDIEQFDREKENEIKRQDKKEEEMDGWFNDLLADEKIKLIDDFWDNATFQQKLDIFERTEI